MNFIPAILIFSAMAGGIVWWLYRFLEREDARMAGEDEVENLIVETLCVGPLCEVRQRIAAAAKKIQAIITEKRKP